MSKQVSKFKNASSEVIEQNILQQDPEGLPACDMKDKLVIAKYVPEMRRVQFLNGRDPGQELMFHYHSKTHPLKHYTLFHGKEYDLPVEIIEHLEDRCENQYAYRLNENGKPECYVKGKKYIFQCKNVKRAA